MSEKARIAVRVVLGGDRSAVLERLAVVTVLAGLFGAAGGFERIAAAFAGNSAIGPALLATALTAAATGLAEPLGGLLGAGTFGVSQAALPWGLAFAAGAMIFAVSHEIIPESRRRGHETRATFGVMTGFVAMMLLDTGLAV